MPRFSSLFRDTLAMPLSPDADASSPLFLLSDDAARHHAAMSYAICRLRYF